jgi:hypothetical protein
MMRTVRLELARCHEFPEGSNAHGYELRLPLTDAGKLDAESWRSYRGDSVFRRFWGGEEEHGKIRHRGHGWTLAFASGGDQDEVIFRADEHRFATGEYLSIKERDDVIRTFRIAFVR